MERGIRARETLTSPSDLGAEVTRKTLAGARWVLLLNVVTIPFSFLTNMLLARLSPLAFGYYAAVMLFSSAFQTLAVLGGPRVFTRLVPGLPRKRRFPFLVSYASLALGVVLAGGMIALAVAPGAIERLLARFGGPTSTVALIFGVEVLLGIFLGHFLWAVLQGSAAAVVTRLPVVGFFCAMLLALGPLRARVLSDPAGYIWISSILVYGVTLLVSCVYVGRTPECRESGPMRFDLPRGFWSAAAFTQLESAVVFVYLSIAPTFVLLWISVTALAPFHAALRYVALFDGASAMLTALLAPGLATLDASGLREDAVRQARAALRAATLFLFPAALTLIFFAPDLMGIFGDSFRAQSGLLRIVALSVLLGPVVHFGGGILIAFGAYRTYLAASVVYVAAAVGLLFALVPTFGVVGAAWCATLTAFMNAIAVALALHYRARVRLPGRVGIGLAIAAAGALTAYWVEPGRLLAAALWLVFCAAFVLAARVTASEATDWVRRLARARAAGGSSRTGGVY